MTEVPALGRLPSQRALLEFTAVFATGVTIDMIELNPVRQRIADLSGRLDALRGFL